MVSTQASKIQQFETYDQKLQVFRCESILGFNSEELQCPPWILTGKTTTPLHIVNLYRKVIMSEIGIFRLNIQQIECDDPYIVQQFIERIIKQIPVNQQYTQDEYYLNVTNNIGQELIVTTEHFRWKNEQENLVSARKHRQLCDVYTIVKLGIGKTLNMTLKMEKLSPVQDDKHRVCMFTAFDTDEQIQKEESGEYMQYNHKRLISEFKLHSLGCASQQFFRENPCSQFLQQTINNHLNNIEVVQTRDQIMVVLNQFPLYIVDPILCEIHEILLQQYQQITPSKTSTFQPCILIRKNIDTTDTQIDLIKSQIIKAISRISKQILNFEKSLFLKDTMSK